MQEVIVLVVLALQLRLQAALAARTGDVRLVNVPNSTMCEGRLDLYSNEKFIQGWFAICDNNFDAEEMQVVCQQLGCPYSNGYRTNVLKYGALPLDTIAYQRECKGSERSLLHCSESGVHTCLHTQAEHYIGIVCSREAKLAGWSVILLAAICLFSVSFL